MCWLLQGWDQSCGHPASAIRGVFSHRLLPGTAAGLLGQVAMLWDLALTCLPGAGGITCTLSSESPRKPLVQFCSFSPVMVTVAISKFSPHQGLGREFLLLLLELSPMRTWSRCPFPSPGTSPAPTPRRPSPTLLSLHGWHLTRVLPLDSLRHDFWLTSDAAAAHSRGSLRGGRWAVPS